MPFSFASPEDLVQLEKSFEAAWAVIVERHGCDPLSASGRRERLAYILASLWRQGVQVELDVRAVEQFEEMSPNMDISLWRPPTEAAD